MKLSPVQFAALDPRNGKGYGRREIPCPKDGDIQAFVRSIRNAEDFASALPLQPSGSWRVLNAFAERIASLAVRRQDVRDLRDGLMAIQLALSLTDDPRETLPALSLLFRAYEMIGKDPAAEFRASAELARPASGNAIMEFLDRSAEDRSIEAMGYGEGDDGAGFRFKRNW